jgi:uncharacterized coiled-coil DUF342 family protein
MKTNWLLLGTLSFGVGFVLGFAVEQNWRKSAAIGGIATVSSLCASYPLTRRYNQALVEKEQQYLNSSKETSQNLLAEIKNFENQEVGLIQDINNQVKTTLEQQLSSLTAQITQIKSLETQQENLQATITNLQAQEQELTELINQKRQIQTQLEQEINSARSQFTDLNEQVNSLHQQSENLQNEISNLQRQDQELRQLLEQHFQEKTNLEKQLNSLTHQIQSLRTEQNGLETRIDELKREEVELGTEIVKVDPNLENLYNHILTGLQNSPYFYNQDIHRSKPFSEYLESLKEAAIELWQSYKSDQVLVKYSDNDSTQAAYMIRYYPNYAGMTFKALETLHNHNQNILGEKVNNKVKVCFFGAGPCPEIVGLSNFLYNNYQSIDTLAVNVFDIDSDGWTPSRNLTRDFIIPYYWKGKLQLKSHQLDLSQTNSLQSISEIIRNSNLFIFQNCLNEIYHINGVKYNLDFLLKEISPNGLIIIIDLSGYTHNISMIDQLEYQANQQNFEVSRHQETWVFDNAIPVPQDIKTNLLTGQSGLIPRKRIKSVFMSMRKKKFVDTLDDIPF